VLAVRDIARTTIEKKLKSEAKLGSWDEQTYYSLAESAEKSHRKLSKLLHDYDIALDVSAATVLHKCMTRGIGERADGEQLPTVEVPSPLLTFAAVSSIDTVKDLQTDETVVGATDDAVTATATDSTASAKAIAVCKAKPSRKSKEAAVLDSIAVIETEWLESIDNIKQSTKQRHHEYQDITASPELLTSALTGISDTTTATSASGSLIARLPALSRRMSRLIGKALYSSSSVSKATQQSDSATSSAIAIQSSPVGIQGALASEDICTAVFSRIHALRATDAGKQVKRRAVIDLLRGLKRQGLSAARAGVPYQTRDALCVLSLPTPYTLQSLATASGTTSTTWLRADAYHYKAIAEVARLRLESEAPASKDITRREGGIMSNYADHLHCLVLQQRAMVSASSADVCDLTHIINKLASLTSNSTTTDNNSLSLLRLADEGILQSALQVQTRGIVSGIEAIEQMLLLTKAVSDSIPTSISTSSNDTVADVKTREQADTGLKTAKATLKTGLEQYQQQQDSSTVLLHSDQLLSTIQKNIGQVTSVSNTLKDLASACTTWLPAQSMATVVQVLDASVDSVQHELQALSDKHNTSFQTTEVTTHDGDAIQAIASQHVTQVREALEAATESLLLSVQSLVTTSQTAANTSTNVNNSDSGNDDNDDTHIEDDYSPLVTLHTAAFEQARALKTWRCTTALQTVYTVLEQFSNEVAQYEPSTVNSEYMAAATVAITAATSDVLELAYQVQAAASAVLTSLIALNKGTAKLSYVLIRVFRTLLCKGICSDKTEDTDDTGDDNGTGGLQFSDDIEGTGMGEGDGKKDVSDQIEDEEQLLGLQSDKQHESKEDKNELDDDNKDDGIEMANDFEGEMHDVPKEDQKDDDNNSDNNDDEQELDREMGDAGDTADVIDERLWDDDDDDNNDDENGTDKEQEKFEQGSRMDGEKLDDEIRTKDDTEDTSKDDSKGKQDDESKQQDEDTAKPSIDAKDEQADGDDDNTNDNNNDNDDQEGPINEDLEDNYEDKPLGIDVKGQENEGNGNDSDNNDDNDDIPDNLELDGNDDGMDDIDDDTANDNNDIDDQQAEQDDDQSPQNDDTTADKDDIDDTNSQDEEETADTNNGGGTSAINDANTNDDQMDVDEPSDNEQEDDDATPIDEQQQQQQQPDDTPAHGIEAKSGDSAILEKQQIDQDGAGDDDQDDNVDDIDDKDDSKQQQPQDESGAQGGTGDNGDGGEWRHDSTNTNETSNGTTDKSRRREAPNPLRSPGNAMEHWHERLDMLKRQENDDQDDTTQGNASLQYILMITLHASATHADTF
jgi:midasin